MKSKYTCNVAQSNDNSYKSANVTGGGMALPVLKAASFCSKKSIHVYKGPGNNFVGFFVNFR